MENGEPLTRLGSSCFDRATRGLGLARPGPAREYKGIQVIAVMQTRSAKRRETGKE
jgi:hypothetical protein